MSGRERGERARIVRPWQSQAFGHLAGAIQSDAALRQSMQPRQMAAATLSDGALLAIL
jgi:hypothetical protein